MQLEHFNRLSMQNSTKIDQHLQLLQARERSLREQQNGLLIPHGKLLGMDVFSWVNPDIHLMINTMHSFPFPVIWIAQTMDWDKIVAHDTSIFSTLEVTIIYDAHKNDETKNNLEEPFKIVKKVALADALKYVDNLNAFKTVLLFTASGNQIEEHINEFENYLALHQIKK
jgi:hypothetical protein